MTEIIIPEGATGITRIITINRRGQLVAENLTTSGYTVATLALTTQNHKTIYNGSITLVITDSVNGEVTWTISTTNLIPAVPKNKDELTIIGQVTLTGSGIIDRTEEFSIIIKRNIISSL